MPLLYQHTINRNTCLAVWKIEEPLSFFADQINLPLPEIHPVKQLQYMASRYLLQDLHPGFPFDRIIISSSGKPFLVENPLYFSISHCANYAAVIISEQMQVGIDVELITAKPTKLMHKFLSEEEQELLMNFPNHEYNTDLLTTLCWSVKETMYKWYSKGGVDFRQHLKILSLAENEELINVLLQKEVGIKLQIHRAILDQLILTWTYKSVAD